MLKGEALSGPFELDRIVALRARLSPSALAVASHAGRVTWAELDERTGRWASALGDLGLEPGARVASLMPNHPDLIVHYLGCMRAGLVAVPLNYRYTSPQIDHALDVSGSSVLIAHEERTADVAASTAAGLDQGVIWHGDGAGPGPTFQQLLAGPDGGSTRVATAPDDPAFIFFTSGSTGPAKGVTHTLDSLGWMVASAARSLEMSAEDIFLPASSMSHIGALLWTMSTLAAGATVIVAHTFDGDEVLPLLREYRPTLLAMIPAALNALVREHGARPEDFASLRLCRSGADHVPSELEEEFLELTGVPIDEGYGMTEIGLATLSPPSGEIRAGSIGTANPGFRLSLRGDDGEEVATGEVGEIWIETPSATTGYWEDPSATAELFEGDWLRSGDLARADEDGYVWFFGRSKQIIVHDGSNISPAEVEDALSEHPAVAQAGVVGVHDRVHGENVRAYVTLAEGAARPTAQELIRFARERIGYRAPEEIVVLDEIPLNPTGKVDRNRLKDLARDHRNPHRT